MTLSQREIFELCEQFAALHDGNLDRPAVQTLERRLQEDREARRLYVRYMRVCAGLAWDIHDGEATDDLPSPAPGSAGVPRAPGTAGETPALRMPTMQWPTKRLLAVLATLAAAIVVAIAIPVWYFHHGNHPNSQIAANKPSDHVSPPPPLAPSPPRFANPVARLIRTANCRWNTSGVAPAVGDALAAGQSLNLASGVAEFRFDIGAKVILQSPAAFLIESPTSARLDAGKVTVEITDPSARGFKILTPGATFVDQGTEFGVEVAPGGSSKVHVFKGLVDVDLRDAAGAAATPSHRLSANAGARIESSDSEMTLLEDTGECFMRSIDDAERDRHTIAYWRFEDRPVGTVLPHTQRNKNPVRATSDSTFNGNDLFVWSPDSRPVFSGDVGAMQVPQIAAANRSCLDLTDPLHSNKTRPEVYTNSRFSHASPLDLQQIAPEHWTVEASVKIKQLQDARQTIVCRDASPGKSARFVLLINPEGGFAVNFIDGRERYYTVNTQDKIKENHWYHVAATSDGHVLRLYADSGDGHGYQCVGSAKLFSTGSTALGNCGADCSWAIGRVRLKKGNVGDGLVGWIDEVRISDVAREPEEFLFAKKTAKSTTTTEDSEDAN